MATATISSRSSTWSTTERHPPPRLSREHYRTTDRAIVAGETTFGKGLVQTVFPISENTGLALTTYHYYTPSGRLIQRNYDGISLYDYYYNHEAIQKLQESAPNREVKMTDSGRTVYGGGGITPDDKNRHAPLQSFSGCPA